MRARGTIAAAAAAVLLAAGPSAARAGQPTGVATAAYLNADYTLVRALNARLGAYEAAPRHVLAGIRADCPLAAAHSPQDPQSTELSNEVIGAMVLTADRLGTGPIDAFVRAVSPLRWPGSPIGRAVSGYVRKLSAMIRLAPPPVCTDVRAWAQTGFTTLPASTVSFNERFVPNWVAVGEQPAALVARETGPERTLTSRINVLEEDLAEAEAKAVETYTAIMNTLELLP